MKFFALILATLSISCGASAAETLLYTDGTYRGQCDSSFFEHTYKNDEMIGVRHAQQYTQTELVISSQFNTQTLEFTSMPVMDGRVIDTVKFTQTANQMSEGLWRISGGSGKTAWRNDWKRTDDGTIQNQTRADRDYETEDWQMITSRRIFMYRFEKIKLGAPRRFKDGALNISTRIVCTYDRI